MRSWHTLSRRTILDCGKYLAVEEHTVALPDGRTIPGWPWIVTPDYVNIVAVTHRGQFVCFRQVKYAVQGTSLAAAGGYIERDEEPLTAAQRELLEETGYEAPRWIELGHYPVDGNRGAGTAHLFLALQAHRVAERHADDLEEQQLVLLSRSEVEAALLAGKFKLLPWSAAIALALHRIEKDEQSSQVLAER
jgi:ADP-ribose pyrophosphatase